MDIKSLIKNMDRDLLKKLIIFLGGVIALFILVIIINVIAGSRISYTDIESRMIKSAKNYYKDNSDKLPKSGFVTISTDKLIEEKYLKDLSKLVKDKDATCTGEVTVTNSNDLLLYSANLNCGKYYETKKLKNVLTSNIVTNGNGIYNINNSYIFRGDSVNNYVKFANKLWRIIKVNSDGTIKIIETTKRDNIEWDDRYNADKDEYVGINNYRVSRIKEEIDKIYNDKEEFTDEDKAYIVNQNLCIGKRSENETNNDGSVECSDILENEPLGLIQVNEYQNASLDNRCTNPTLLDCTNYNYLADIGGSYWTLNANKDNSFEVYKISGTADLISAFRYSQIKLVINLNSNVNYVDGDGTEENPYTIK